MSTAIDVFGNLMFKPIDFTTKKEGIVVGNNHFETEQYLDIFIQELFVADLPMLSKVTHDTVNDDNVYTETSHISSDKRASLQDLVASIKNQLAVKEYENDGKKTYLTSLISTAESMVSKGTASDPEYEEMFTNLQTALKAGLTEQSFTENLDTTKIINPINLTFNSTVTDINYIKCFPKMQYGFNPEQFKTLPDNVKNMYKPPVGSIVTVEFLDGDPKLPYYEFKSYFYFDPESIPDSEGHTGDDIYNNPGVVNPNDSTNTGLKYYPENYYRLIRPTQPAMNGGDVLKLRNKFKELGAVFTNAARNIPNYQYDPELEAFVVKFQVENKVTDTDKGIVGPTTFDMIMDKADYAIGQVVGEEDKTKGRKYGTNKVIFSPGDDKLKAETIALLKKYDVVSYNVFNEGYDYGYKHSNK